MVQLRKEDMTVINMISSNFEMRTKTAEDFMNNLKELDKCTSNIEVFSSNFNFPVFSIYDWYANNSTNEKILDIIKFINM